MRVLQDMAILHQHGAKYSPRGLAQPMHGYGYGNTAVQPLGAKMAKQSKPTAMQAVVQAVAPAAPAAPAKAVALRGGQAVATVQVVAGAVYRTKAPHNVAWWATLTGLATAQPVAVATVVAAPHSVPTHFVGYCLRRGYLQAVA